MAQARVATDPCCAPRRFVTALSGANAYVSAIEAVREERAGVGSNNEVGMSAIALQDLPQYNV